MRQVGHRFARAAAPSKYNAKAVVYRGMRFDSKLEARFCEALDRAKERGAVIDYLRQVPIHLECSDKLVVDFLVFWSDGQASLVDTKGMETPEFQRKRKRLGEQRPELAQALRLVTKIPAVVDSETIAN